VNFNYGFIFLSLLFSYVNCEQCRQKLSARRLLLCGNVLSLRCRNRFSAGRAGQPQAKPLSSNLHSASAEEIEERHKLEQRARRFAASPPAKSQSLSSAKDVVKLGTKRPSDQGLETGGQSAAKQMRLIASRKVVAKAKATVVQQRQNVLPLRQPQQGMLTAQLPASVSQQASTVQRIPASQRIGVRSVQTQQQQQQPTSRGNKTAAVSATRPIRPISDVSCTCS